MNISFSAPMTAPQTTGHPAALPMNLPPPRSDTKVTELESAPNTASIQKDQEGKPIDTPPTAMQRQIMELLEKQAEALNEA